MVADKITISKIKFLRLLSILNRMKIKNKYIPSMNKYIAIFTNKGISVSLSHGNKNKITNKSNTAPNLLRSFPLNFIFILY